MHHPISEKSAFAPIRYQASRPWWKSLGKLAAQVAMSDFAKRSKLLHQELHPAVIKAVRERLGVRDPHVFQNETNEIQTFGGFLGYGRVIYEISEALADNLAVTEFDEVALEDLELRPGTVYLHFGDHPVLNIEGVQYEGIYVSWLERESLLSINVVRHRAFQKKPIHFMVADTSESLPVFFLSKEQTLNSAISASRQRLENQNKEALQQVEQIKQQFIAQGMDPDVSAVLQAIGVVPSEEMYRRITSLSLAVLCFLSARPDDIEEGWPVDTPSELAARAMAPTGARKEAAQRQLENEGYLRVRYVGAKFADSSDTVRFFRRGESSGDIARIIATHPRRGFFRRQACGPGYSERRIKYIAPTIVNPGGSKLGTGKIYTVE